MAGGWTSVHCRPTRRASTDLMVLAWVLPWQQQCQQQDQQKHLSDSEGHGLWGPARRASSKVGLGQVAGVGRQMALFCNTWADLSALTTLTVAVLSARTCRTYDLFVAPCRTCRTLHAAGVRLPVGRA